MKDIGKKIRELREMQGMTQEELAHKVGYKSRVSINKIELQRDVPLNKLAPIAEALGTTPSYLAGWDEEIEKEVPQYNPAIQEFVEILPKLTKEQIDSLLHTARLFVLMNDDQ